MNQFSAKWTNEDSLNCNKDTNSIVNTPRVGDILDNNFIGWGRQGWVCPKCGRVMSPDTPFCLFCSKEIKTTVTTGTGGTDEYVKNNVETKKYRWEIDCDGYYPYCTNCGEEPYEYLREHKGILPHVCPNCHVVLENTDALNNFSKLK